VENVLGIILACLIGGLLTALGGFCVLAVLLTVWQGLGTRSWPVAVGQIIEKDSEGESHAETESAPRIPVETPPAARRLVYEYEVDGKRFTAGNVLLRGNARSDVTDRVERELASRFRVGESVLVYYNPAKPDEPLLQPGIPAGLVPLAVVGVGLLAVGLALILFFTGAVTFPPDPSVTAVFFLVPGLALTLFALRRIGTVAASRSWPTVEARVVCSTATSFRGGNQVVSDQPAIAYQYEVGEETYVGTQLDWGRFGSTRAGVQRVAEEYPVGRLVTVYYDPSRPYRSVIEPRGWAMSFFLLAFGLAFIGGGVLMLTALR
jgi:hypothetical protein